MIYYEITLKHTHNGEDTHIATFKNIDVARATYDLLALSEDFNNGKTLKLKRIDPTSTIEKEHVLQYQNRVFKEEDF